MPRLPKGIRVGIVGCGRIASGYDHLPLKGRRAYTHTGAYLLHRCRIAAADSNPEARQAFAWKWGVNEIFSDYRRMLRMTSPKVVSICTPSELRYPVVKAAVDAGVGAILCEKPIALSLGEAQRMVELCQRSGVRLVVNYYLRAVPGFIRLREILKAKALGRVRTIVIHYSRGVINNGTHAIDLLRFLLGEVERVRAVVPPLSPKQEQKDPTVAAELELAEGAMAYLVTDPRLSYSQFTVELACEAGKVVSAPTAERLALYRLQESLLFAGFQGLHKVGTLLSLDSSRAFPTVVGLVLAGLEHENSLSTGRDAWQALSIALAVRRSLRRGGRWESVPSYPTS